MQRWVQPENNVTDHRVRESMLSAMVQREIDAIRKAKLLSPDQQKEVGLITATFRGGKFAKLLAKLEPALGTTAVRFVIKDPNVIKYIDTPSCTTDIAADGG